MELNLTEREQGILLGLATSACLEAVRADRTGPWVDSVKVIVSQVEYALSHAAWKVHPKGGEPFGTKVTFWSGNWGTRCAIITSSPKPEGQREFLDVVNWGIAIRPDDLGSGGMTYVPAELLTLGWHPEAQGMGTP